MERPSTEKAMNADHTFCKVPQRRRNWWWWRMCMELWTLNCACTTGFPRLLSRPCMCQVCQSVYSTSPQIWTNCYTDRLYGLLFAVMLCSAVCFSFVHLISQLWKQLDSFFMACFICFVQFLPQLVSPRASWFGRLAKAAHGCGPVARTCLGPTHDYPNNIQWPFKQCFKYSFCIFWIFLVLLSSVSDAKDKYHFSIPTFSSQILQIAGVFLLVGVFSGTIVALLVVHSAGDIWRWNMLHGRST